MRILDFADGFESSSSPSSVAFPASTVSVTPSGNLSSTTAQNALQELQGDIDTLNGKIGTANGIAPTGADNKIPASYLPSISIVTVQVVANIAARDALTVESGDIVQVTDAGGGVTKTFAYTGSAWLDIHSDAALTAHTQSSSAHSASSITNTPSGNLAASTVQAALNELQSDIDTRATSSALSTHIADTANPHAVTKAQVGLGNVDNTSDATKNSAAAVLTNKDFDGGTASNTSRITLPKATKSTLDGLTRKEATVVYATDQAKAYIDNGSSLIAIGSGSGGTVNFVTNPKAENDILNAGTYADSGSRPTDGTGGSPSVTLTRESSGGLDTTDFLLTKPASNVQGQGYYWDVVIPRYARGKVCQITIYYEIASGTYSGGTSSTDSDLIAYLYSVTDSKLNEPAPIKLDGGVSGIQYRYTGTFQTSTTDAAYRLLLHHATTSTSAFTVKAIVSVSPQVVSVGGIATDWQSYTPTSSWSSNVVHTGKWKRVGDTMYIKTRSLLSGGSENATYRIDLPAGYTVDTSKLPSTTATGVVLGYGSVLDSGVNNYPVGVWYGSTTSVNAFVLNSASTYAAGAYVAQAVPITGNIGASDEINLEFSVPITGWGTSMQLSSDSSEGRVVAVRAASSVAQSIASGSYTTVLYGTVNNDTHGAYNASTGIFTPPVPGFYNFKAQNTLQATTTFNGTTETWGLELTKVTGTTLVARNYSYPSSASVENYVSLAADDIYLNAGEQVYIRAFQSSGGALNLNGGAGDNFLSIHKVSGNTQIAASETYSARYYSTAGQSIPNTGINVINFDTKDKDTHGSVTTGSGWLFTAQAPGEFSVSATVWAQAAAWTAGQIAYLSIYKNPTISSGAVTGGTVVNDGNLFNGFGATLNVGLNVTDKVKLLAGETVCITMTQNRTGGAVSLSTSAQRVNVQITRTGNY